MKINIVAIEQKPFAWCNAAMACYQQRLPKHLTPHIHALPACKSQQSQHCRQQDTQTSRQKLQQLNTARSGVNVFLDPNGQPWSSQQFADNLSNWQQWAAQVNFVIGGAYGHDRSQLDPQDHLWSLSPLTFPHSLVTVILLEQLYRAHTIIINHPYHK